MHAHRLDTDELRELHPAELILECAGIRHAPGYAPATLRDLRAANRRMGAACDAAAAAAADEEFHRRLTAGWSQPRLLEVWQSVRLRFAPYKRAYLRDRSRAARAAAEHEAILGLLERGEHRDAERRLRAHEAHVLHELLGLIETGRA
jgi:DNA-binding GntR family transcriptional regulator